jgi:hypothetical protein
MTDRERAELQRLVANALLAAIHCMDEVGIRATADEMIRDLQSRSSGAWLFVVAASMMDPRLKDAIAQVNAALALGGVRHEN